VIDGAMRRPQADDDPHTMFPYSPVCGWLNPLAVPATWARDGDGVRGTVRMPVAYNGPPGFVHGGIIAEVFDEVLGTLAVMHGIGGFTGTLTVRYRSPTPILVDLDLTARVDRTEGRKAFIVGELRHEGRLCAEAEGIFIRMADSPTGLPDIPGISG